MHIYNTEKRKKGKRKKKKRKEKFEDRPDCVIKLEELSNGIAKIAAKLCYTKKKKDSKKKRKRVGIGVDRSHCHIKRYHIKFVAKIIILINFHTVSPLTPNTEQQSGSPVHLIPFIIILIFIHYTLHIIYIIFLLFRIAVSLGVEPNLQKKKGPLLAQGALCIRGTQLYRGAKGTQPDPGSRFSAPNSAVSLRTILFIFWGGISESFFFALI